MSAGRKAERAALAVLLVLALGALACGGGGSDDAAGTADRWMRPTPTAAPPPTAVPGGQWNTLATSTPAGVSGWEALRATPGAVGGTQIK